MKKLIYLFTFIGIISMTSCINENYKKGSNVGTIANFGLQGNLFKSYEGHLNVTQTGMNSSTGMDFSIDNDNEPVGVVQTLQAAQDKGWKVKITYHEVFLKNLFSNRGHTDCFVTSVQIEDSTFNTIFKNTPTPDHSYDVDMSHKGHVVDTVINISVTLDEARKNGWIK